MLERSTWAARWSLALPVVLAAVALASDTANRRIPYGILRTGPIDEVAHVTCAALGLLVLQCLVDAPRRFYVAALVASVAIDLDHVPYYVGLEEGSSRPVTHSLATIVVVLVAAALLPRHRAVLVGVAVGLVLHFARDVAEGVPGVRLLWPFEQHSWTGARWQFFVLVLGLALARIGLAAVRKPRQRPRVFADASSA